MIRVYHTSDVHDRRHLAAPIRALRAARPGLYVDCGDSLRGSQTVFHRREPIIAELDAAGVDLQAMGNREFHYVPAAVGARIAQMHHPVVCANLVRADGAATPFGPDRTLETPDGAIRFFGLLVVQYPTGSAWEKIFRWRFLDPFAVAERIAAATPAGVALVALSHLGLRADRELARRVPRLDAILGGHSHDTLQTPEIAHGVPIVHAGPYAAFASRNEFVRDGARWRLAASVLEPLR